MEITEVLRIGISHLLTVEICASDLFIRETENKDKLLSEVQEIH